MASQRPQCSSVLQAVLLEDIRPLFATHVRRESCHCQACGGERLAHLLRSTAIPLALTTTSNPPKPRLIHRARRPALQGTCQRSDPATPLFRPPPVTPALSQFLHTAASFSKPCTRSSRLIRTASKLPGLRRVPSYCLPTRLSTGKQRKRSYGS